MKKQIVTVTWSYSQEVEVPDDATIDSLNDYKGAHEVLGAEIISDASANFNWREGQITDIQDIH